MTLRYLAFAAVMAAAVPLATAVAQTVAPPASAPSPAIAASVPLNTKTDKRNLTPTEGRNSAPSAGDLQPDRRAVTPQVSIPLNNKGGAVPPKSLLVPAPRAGGTAPSGGIDDSVARCNALGDAQARDQCRDKLGR